MSITDSEKNKWLSNLQETNTEFIDLLEAFLPEEINTVPFGGGWTAGQVAQHVHKSDQGMLMELTGPVKRENRRPDQYADMISKTFLDFETKLQSPAFIIPESREYKKDFIITRFKETRSKIGEAVQASDLTETCAAFPFPGVGELTKLEIINFVIVHTKRHIHQLRKIAGRMIRE
jgi:hypothetical protein